MKKLILILSLFISLGASAQTLNSLPAGSKPYGNQLYITPDGLIIAGTTTIKYRVVGTKSYIDSLNTIYDNKYLPLTGGALTGNLTISGAGLTSDYLTVNNNATLPATSALNLAVAGGSVYMDNYGLNATQSIIKGRSLIDYPNGVLEFIGSDSGKDWKFKNNGDGKLSLLTYYNSKGFYFDNNEITAADGVRFVKEGEALPTTGGTVSGDITVNGQANLNGNIISTYNGNIFRYVHNPEGMLFGGFIGGDNFVGYGVSNTETGKHFKSYLPPTEPEDIMRLGDLTNPTAGYLPLTGGTVNGTLQVNSGVKANDILITYGTGSNRKLSIETGASDPIDVIKYDNYGLYLGNTNANPVTGDIHIQGNGTDGIKINNNNEIWIDTLIAPVTGYDLIVQDGGNFLRKVPVSGLGFATMGVSNFGNFIVDGYLRAGQASLDYNSGTNTVTLQNGSAGGINLNGYTVSASYNLEAANQITAPEIKANKFTLSAIQTAPSSATDSGNAGEIRIASDYIYVCIATNQWVRTALTTW